jgi:hypothetical protein
MALSFSASFAFGGAAACCAVLCFSAAKIQKECIKTRYFTEK